MVSVRTVILLVASAHSYMLPLSPRPQPPGRARPAINQIQPFDGPESPQQKPKSKTDRFELQFTCNMCDSRNSHSISRHAYTKGTVIVTCPSCNATHLVADNLNCARRPTHARTYPREPPASAHLPTLKTLCFARRD